MPQLPQRKSPRLPDYDYSKSGGYFVTICTHERQHLFGEIEDTKMRLTLIGHLATSIWHTIPQVFPLVVLGDFVVMPNHLHGILFITDDAGKRPTLGHIVGNYKGTVTREAKRLLNNPHLPIWQGRFHEHIIRTEERHLFIREYVQHNVARWADDSLNNDS